LELSGRDGAGLLIAPVSANGRGLREAGFAPGHGPGFASLAAPGLDVAGIAEGLGSGDLHTVWLHQVDPLRNFPNPAAWNKALHTAQTVIAVESQMTETVREHADVVFPAEGYPEKEGTLTHPDGRLQRLRPGIGHPRGAGGQPGTGVRALWQVIAEVAKRLGHDPGELLTGFQVSTRLLDTVPFYKGITVDEIGGRGVRWQERNDFEVPAWELAKLDVPAALPSPGDGALRLGTYRPLWADKAVDLSPALHFIRARQVAELSPADAAAFGVNDGDRVEVGNGTRVAALAKIRDAVPAGSIFLAEGIAADNANVLTHALVEVHRVGPGPIEASATPIQVQPAVEGLSEMPQSAPLPIPPREVT
jgi:NADH-quinone oxidoreductase subunit G